MAFVCVQARPSWLGESHARSNSSKELNWGRRPRPCFRRFKPSAVLHQNSSRPVSNQSAKAVQAVPFRRHHEFSPDDVEAVRIRHCLVDTEKLAEHVFQEVVSRKFTLAEISRHLSTCAASKNSGGDLGWWWKEEALPSNAEEFGINEELLGVAVRTRPHKVERTKTRDGWHVFVVEEVRNVLRTKRGRTPFRQQQQGKNYSKLRVPEPVENTYSIETLGCQMNRSDSERMAGVLSGLGYKEIEDPLKASVLVLNTCNIREHAEKKVYSYMGRHAERKRMHPQSVTLAVAGCVAQQEGERLLRRIPELDLVFGPQYVNRLGDLLEDVERNQCQVAATEPVQIQEDISKPVRESTVTAWINVMYGCGERCTFCTVGNVVRPYEQSRALDAIKTEIADAAKSGIREVVLLGQNIDAYGRDMYPKRTFAELLRFIHGVEGIDRIRFTTSHPRYISHNLVKTCAELPKVMPYFHIPPQSGNNDVLKAMNRGYTTETFLSVVERIRDVIPDAAICGDMIVGFPGETEEQFQDSLLLMTKVGFDSLNTAAYSPRPNTPAAEFENQIPEVVKADRLARMNALVTEHARERSNRYLGRVEHVLVEKLNERNAEEVVGRNATNRHVRFRGSLELKGKIVPVRIVEVFPFSLRGEQIGEAY